MVSDEFADLFDAELDALIIEFDREDALGLAIRSIIHIENQLIGIAADCLPAPTALPQLMGFDLRVDLAIGCGLPNFFKAPLRAMGKLRNRFAHRLDAKFGTAEMDALHHPLPAELKVGMELVFQRIRETGLDFDLTSPTDRLKLHSLALLIAMTQWRVHTRRRLAALRSQ